jgi:hypothetical protein
MSLEPTGKKKRKKKRNPKYMKTQLPSTKLGKP